MRMTLIILTLCYAVDALEFDGRFLRNGLMQIQATSNTVSRNLKRWMTPDF